MIRSFLFSVFFALLLQLRAQQVEQLSLRVYEPIVYNPAVAGSNSYPEIKLHHRSQWIGFEGAPMTSMLSYHNELGKQMGLGGYIINDMYGAYRRTALDVSYAYHLRLKSVYWAFGLGASAMQLALDGSKATIKDPSDERYFSGSKDNVFEPDITFGTYLYNRRFFVGLSVVQLLGTKAKLNFDSDLGATIPLTQHYYLIGGYSFSPNKQVELEPSVLVSNAVSSPIQVDVNLKLDYKNTISGGVTYRHGDAIVLMVGYKISRYFIGYSYDMTISNLRKENSGSHEIVFAFNWPYTPDSKPMYDLKGTDRGQLRKRFR